MLTLIDFALLLWLYVCMNIYPGIVFQDEISLEMNQHLFTLIFFIVEWLLLQNHIAVIMTAQPGLRWHFTLSHCGMRGNFNICVVEGQVCALTCVVIALTEESITNQKMFTFWKWYLLAVKLMLQIQAARWQRMRMDVGLLVIFNIQISFEATATYWLVEQEMYYVQSLSRKGKTNGITKVATKA